METCNLLEHFVVSEGQCLGLIIEDFELESP
jgi:hypothetical protein